MKKIAYLAIVCIVAGALNVGVGILEVSASNEMHEVHSPQSDIQPFYDYEPRDRPVKR